MERLVAIGQMEVGRKNNICDVPFVRVGHFTIHRDNHHTGVTTVIPHEGNLFMQKVPAASFVFNGFGKSVGFMQIDELGMIETPIILTNTLAVGKAIDACVTYSLTRNPEIGRNTGTVNSIVLECNDGKLNDIRTRIIDEDMVLSAINDATDDFKQGSVGAGAGMICHGFKGGIGSSSRLMTFNGKTYTLGVLVNANFGHSKGVDLIFKGRPIGKLITKDQAGIEEEKGSIAVVVATDLPLDNRQLRRVLMRAEIGIGRTGTYAGNGSGDVFVAFSTASHIAHSSLNAITKRLAFHDSHINTVFRAVVEATEEAILNAMLTSPRIKGFLGEVPSLLEYQSYFQDLLVKK